MIYHVITHVIGQNILKGRLSVKSKYISGTALTAVLSASLLAGGYGHTAYAQDDTSRLGGAFDDEIIVTARKREESVQDIPVAVTAFSGESLEARGITKIDDVGKIAPNVNYQNNPAIGGSSSVSTVYIRGIGQRDFLGTIDNGSGFYIDDVIVARTVGAVVDLLDVERVEVLRGPQGTLNGRNNVGGAIKIHTKKPSYEAGGYVDATYGTDNLVRIKGSFDIPIAENAAIKLSALYGHQDGYVDRPAGGDLGETDVKAYRGALLWEPTDSIEVNLSASFSDEEDNGPAFVLIQTGADLPGGFAGFYNNLNAGTPDCAGPGGVTSTNPLCYNDGNYVSENLDTNFGTAPTFSETEVTTLNADVKFQISDDLSLRSITGYRDLDAQFARDQDGSPLTVVHFFDDFVTEQFSQELQLNANLFDDKVDLVAGLYYFEEDGNNINRLEFAIANFISGSQFGTESKAIYSQATFHATDRLDITVGGRYTDEDKTFLPDQIAGPNNLGIPFLDEGGNCVSLNRAGQGPFAEITPVPAAACPFRLLPEVLNETNTKRFTPMVNLAYDLNDETLLYATYSEGFRSGGFAQRIFPDQPRAPDFGPEFVDSYEAGFKFKNDTVTFNAAAFFTDYSDIQVAVLRPPFIGFFEDNVGDAEIKGIELETIINPFDGLYLEASYGYTDAAYTEIDAEASLVTVDDSFDHVPEHTFAAAINKEFNLSNGGAIIARVDTSYWTEYANDPDNSPEIFTPDTFLANASLKWLAPSDKYSVSVGVKNLTDNEYLQSGYLADTIGTSDVIFDRGRQFFVNARANF